MEAALIQAVIGIVGELLASDQREEAEAILGRMRTQFEGIELPELEEIEAITVGPSAMEGVSTDPTLEAAQYDSLGQLGEVAEDGLAAVDSATLNRIANQVARRQKAGAAGIESDMAARGLAGSGMDYATRAQMASDANQRLSEEGQNIGAESLERRLKAISGRGEMAGKMRGQSFDEKSATANAQDTANRFNAQMRTGAQQYNAQLPQKRFQNQMQKLGAVADPMKAGANLKLDGATDTRNAFVGYGAAAGAAYDAAKTGGKTTTYNSREDDEDEDD